ncbi:MAG: fumarate hydratase C-terminal domain-containing protein [Candidatus Omnitrophica bacterium]|nr:fumarate hydratase C-terminal domain-containing protein [Candidatus Omnitrophota bacterium]
MKFENLKSGEQFFLNDFLYTARDQAHSRLLKLIKAQSSLPIDLSDSIIYYCGPSATPNGRVVGSCGPTTSSRMDMFVEPLLKAGLRIMIGKGRRSKKVRMLIKKYKAIYFIAPAGCGALLSTKIVSKKLICFKDLGPEAIYRLKVKDFPLIVAIDSKGHSIYEDI